MILASHCMQVNSLISKIAILTLHFPRLRIIWSRSLHASADIFRTLKSNQDQPDPIQAAAVGKHEAFHSHQCTFYSWGLHAIWSLAWHNFLALALLRIKKSMNLVKHQLTYLHVIGDEQEKKANWINFDHHKYVEICCSLLMPLSHYASHIYVQSPV